MFNFYSELDSFKKEIQTKKLTEQISGKLNRLVKESTIRDRVVDTRQLMSRIRVDSQLNSLNIESLITLDGWFVYLPSYTTIYQHLARA